MYAEETRVPVTQSRTEIEEICAKAGATKIGIILEPMKITLGFEMKERGIRIVMPLPDITEDRFQKKGKYHKRTKEAAQTLWEKAVRAKWRALYLVLKAKLESVEAKIETFEEAFLAHVVMPKGQTVGNWLRPQLDAAYRTGGMPPLLQASNP